jgi:hypothetical protein
MTWLRPVDRTSGTLTLSAGTLSCLAHHGTPLSKRCPTTTALEHTIVPMDDADRMPALGAVKPRQEFFDAIHRGQWQGRRTANDQWVCRTVPWVRDGSKPAVTAPQHWQPLRLSQRTLGASNAAGSVPFSAPRI